MRAIALCAFAAIVVAPSFIAATLHPTPVVETPDGPVQGLYNDASGVDFFKGIPFAAPPIGTLRFADTEPVTPWNAVLNATTYAPGCMSICPPVGFPRPKLMCTDTVSEDCLYLNVFVPNSTAAFTNGNAKALNGTKNYPVVVFFPGGDYKYGSGGVPAFDGQELARTQGVIVVTINYRLGLFGALYTGSTVEGNYHIKDQIQALKWVQKNIGAFGGDKTQVTISGQSAGAYSVATLLAVPAAVGLYAKAIMLSAPFSLLANRPQDAIDLGTKVLTALGCPESGGDLQVACLRAAPAEQLLNLSDSVKPEAAVGHFLARMMQWVPIVDGVFLPYQPMEAYKLGAFNKVPVFFGTVANESVEFINIISEKPISSSFMDAVLLVVFGVEQGSQIIDFYGSPPASMKHDAKPFMEVMATDFIFYCAARSVGASLTQHVPTFMWTFDFIAWINKWLFEGGMPFCVDEVCHAQDLTFVFYPLKWVGPWPGEPLPPPLADDNLASVMQGAWGNFIYTGNPNPVGAGLPPSAFVPGTHFPQFNASINALVNYSVPTSPLVGYRNDVCDFWDTIGYLKRR